MYKIAGRLFSQSSRHFQPEAPDNTGIIVYKFPQTRNETFEQFIKYLHSQTIDDVPFCGTLDDISPAQHARSDVYIERMIELHYFASRYAIVALQNLATDRIHELMHSQTRCLPPDKISDIVSYAEQYCGLWRFCAGQLAYALASEGGMGAGTYTSCLAVDDGTFAMYVIDTLMKYRPRHYRKPVEGDMVYLSEKRNFHDEELPREGDRSDGHADFPVEIWPRDASRTLSFENADAISDVDSDGERYDNNLGDDVSEPRNTRVEATAYNAIESVPRGESTSTETLQVPATRFEDSSDVSEQRTSIDEIHAIYALLDNTSADFSPLITDMNRSVTASSAVADVEEQHTPTPRGAHRRSSRWDVPPPMKNGPSNGQVPFHELPYFVRRWWAGERTGLGYRSDSSCESEAVDVRSADVGGLMRES